MPARKYFVVGLMILLTGKTPLAAEVAELPFDSLPEAVKTSVLNYVEKQRINKISQITDGNLVRFEIEADKTQNNKEVTALKLALAENGKIMKVSKEVPYYALSYPQMQAIEKQYPGIKVTEAEAVETHYFEIVGNVNGQAVKFRLQENSAVEDLGNP